MGVHEVGCLLLALAVAPADAANDGPPKAQKARIASLIEQLGDLDLDKQNDAQQQLARLAETARPALLEAMSEHADEEVRRQARVTLARINATGSDRLVKQLADPD